VGINVVLEFVPVVADRTTAGDFDTALVFWPGRSDPDYNLYRFLATSGNANVGGYSNPRLDLILENGRKALTTKARKTLYHVAQQIVLDDRPMIFLYHPTKYIGVSTQVAGVQIGQDSAVHVAFAQFR